MNPQKIKSNKHNRRKARVKAKIFGTAKKPRLSVFRSLKHISAQLIDDEKGKTLVSVRDKELKKSVISDQESGDKKNKTTTKIALAFEVGKLLAEKSIAKKIKTCIFDKSKYKYHGRIKAVAEGAREKGLRF